MKKLMLLLLAAAMALSLVGCGNGNGTEQQQGSETDQQEQDEMQDSDNEKGYAMPMLPPNNLELQAENDYPYMGIKFNVSDQLKEMADTNQMFITTEGKLSEVQAMTYSVVSFHFIAEDQRSKTPGGDNRDSITDYEEYEKWIESGYKIAEIGVYDKQQLESQSIEELTELPVNEKLGEAGNYEFYFSMNEPTDETSEEFIEMYNQTKALFDEMKASMTVSEPVEIDKGSFMGFTIQPRSKDTNIGDFKATDIDGNEVSSDVFADYDITMVNIWTTWCSACISELPFLNEIAEEYKSKGVNIIGIINDVADPETGKIDEEKQQLTKKICEKAGVEYTTLIPDNVLSEGLLNGIGAYPETHFVDKDGNYIGELYKGSRSKEDWCKIIDELLKESGNAKN